MGLHLLTSPFRERHRGIEHGSWKENDELLAAVATHLVDLARRRLENARELLQHRVARLMAVRVVHRLEVIEIEHRARQRLVQPHRVLEHVMQ